MSAYIVQPEHIGALAAYAANKSAVYDWRDSNPLFTCKNIARHLARANIASIEARYGKGEADDFCGGPSAEFVSECEQWAEKYYFQPPGLNALDYWNMAGCLDYQACEVPDWNDSLACRQLNWIKSSAVRSLPGFDESVRDFSTDATLPEKGTGPVLISMLGGMQ